MNEKVKVKQLVVPIIVIAIMSAFLLYQFDFFGKPQSKTSSSTGDEVSINKIKDETKNNAEYPEKEKILLRMLDSIDYIKTLEGEYQVFSRDVNEVWTTKYAVDVKGRRSVVFSVEDNKTILRLEKEKKKIEFYENDHTYQEFPPVPMSKNEDYAKLSPTERLYGKDRTDDTFAKAANVIHTENSIYLIRYEDWNFKEVTYLGLPSYKITGVIDKSVSESLAGKFDMIVEKSAGLLLSFNVYDENNKVKHYFKTKSIKIDKGVNEKVFEKDLSKYKKIENAH
ncbi:hypothetical protein ACQKP0_10460 [Heyndrickxia sp. NPDC080065]|uniref:hypothetical protein n=1 Tax=Heyndrickxia sp. NPDC080065 TaxID=3390568 RepID=UPI003CFCEAD2